MFCGYTAMFEHDVQTSRHNCCIVRNNLDKERKYAEMKEVKSPKRPLIFYYGIVLVVLLVFNLFITPMLAERQVKEVDYGTFMKMTEDKDIGQVQIDSTQITFTDKAESAIYKTGLMPDDDLTQRLYDSGAKFSKEIETRTSPFMSFLMSVVLPLLEDSSQGR